MIRSNKAYSGALALAVSAVLASPAQALETTVKFGGYVKFDAIVSDYSQPSPAPQSNAPFNTHRDFLVPSLLPTGPDATDGQGKKYTDFHAKQSRFNLKTTTTLDNGDVIKGLFEMDFGPGSEPSNGERGTNRSGVDLRHAAIFYKNWIFGQTWTTALNGASIAETLNFFPLPDGMISARQAQVRYTTGNFAVALENPLTRVRGSSATSRETDDGTMPDIIAKYTHKADWGLVSVAGIVRELAMDADGVDDSVNASVINVAGRIKAGGKNDIRFSVSSGDGIGRYIALAINDDAFVDANNQLQTIDATAFNVSYRHFWTATTRSNFGYSQYEADTTGIAGINKKATTASVNVLFSPAKPLTLGVELILAKLEKEGGNKGEVKRVQFSAKYAF